MDPWTFLLFVQMLTISSIVVSGSTKSSSLKDLELQALTSSADCENVLLFKAQLDKCYQRQGLPALKFPWDQDLLKSTGTFAELFGEQSCQQQFHQREVEAYRCLHHTCRHCFQRFLEDDAIDDEDILFFQDLHLYMPDPDLIANALRDICEVRDEDWSCVSSTQLHPLLQCGLRGLLRLPRVLGFLSRPLEMKPFMCRIFTDVGQCATEGMKDCPLDRQTVVSRIMDNLTPPACLRHGFAEIDQDQGEKKPAIVHDEI